MGRLERSHRDCENGATVLCDAVILDCPALHAIIATAAVRTPKVSTIASSYNPQRVVSITK